MSPRRFYEVGCFGSFALNRWLAEYVEIEQAPSGRTPPSPQHVYVGTRSTSPTVVQIRGWLDCGTHKLRLVEDKHIIRGILAAEKATAVLAEQKLQDMGRQ